MRLRAISACVILEVVLSAATLHAPVAASEWGCEVLFCASSSKPSWRGVSACHPPMKRLIAAMNKPGFDWPACPEAGTSRPGHERYAACPEGYRVGRRKDGDSLTQEGDLCVKTVSICQDKAHGFYNSDRQRSCIQTISISRPLRLEPYYFDIENDTSGQTERHWFELNR
ncbi:hypothetical protein [Shinella zoogloeoides]|jgi:hypothetical protein|uniref:hypothetical protein n=1 Tax=Shinella zoogloeoides TaxID=352475 RepID=UPI00273D411F|nr:hypothetical protein [Shinella zoogloeoides]WLR95725.1 hypothetical protein Q9316_23640 [Shinella zoogloeoides]